MRRTRHLTTTAAALILACAANALAFRATLAAASTLRLEGTSTIHPWAADSKDFRAELALSPAAGQTLTGGISAQSPATLTVTIPVASLKSEHSGLDKNMQKALKSDKNPNILFVMKSYLLSKDGAQVTATGDLTIAGVTKAETLAAALSLKEGKAVVDGEKPLSMTDFGVKPPTMMMGAVKTGDKVVVKFHLVLEQGAEENKGARQ